MFVCLLAFIPFFSFLLLFWLLELFSFAFFLVLFVSCAALFAKFWFVLGRGFVYLCSFSFVILAPVVVLPAIMCLFCWRLLCFLWLLLLFDCARKQQCQLTTRNISLEHEKVHGVLAWRDETRYMLCRAYAGW